MAETTKTLAKELRCSERQVINYKAAVETHCGFTITRRQGKRHYFLDEYVDLVRKYATSEPLPPFNVSPSGAIPVEVLSSEEGHPNLSVRKMSGVPERAGNRSVVFPGTDASRQRGLLNQESTALADTTFQNLGGLRALLSHFTVEGFRNAAAVDLRNGLAAYQEEMNRGMEQVAGSAKKGGFADLDLTA